MALQFSGGCPQLQVYSSDLLLGIRLCESASNNDLTFQFFVGFGENVLFLLAFVTVCFLVRYWRLGQC
jgi:hypothetical protein